jgi:hypothetical protein
MGSGIEFVTARSVMTPSAVQSEIGTVARMLESPQVTQRDSRLGRLVATKG